MKRYPILDICARIDGHEVQHQKLRSYCHEFQDWENLLTQAEKEGIAPLLRKHLIESESAFPISVRRSLNILYKRHQKKAALRLRVLQEILELFRGEQLTPILIKGAALCYTTYPDPALRPMRDMDILLHQSEVDTAQKLLINTGFKPSTAPKPEDHHHLSALLKRVDGVTVCIELHRGLYPDCPPYYPEVSFDKLLATAKEFTIEDGKALTFSNEETLHYLYQHAFHAPLTYEPYKLINVADIIGFTELNYSKLDWSRIPKDFPLLYNALPLLQHISPWNFNKVPADFVSLREQRKDRTTTPFIGWPHRRLKEQKEGRWNRYQILRDTLFPPFWWLRIYYGVNISGLFRCLLWQHPRHILWWAKLYASFLETEAPSQATRDESFFGSKLYRGFQKGIAFLKKIAG